MRTLHLTDDEYNVVKKLVRSAELSQFYSRDDLDKLNKIVEIEKRLIEKFEIDDYVNPWEDYVLVERKQDNGEVIKVYQAI